MLSTDSSSSNWDFTPVINLLRSPTYGGGHSTVPTRHNEVSVGSFSAEKLKHVDSNAKVPARDVNRVGNPPRLGDFSSLWEFLGQATAPASAKTADVELPSGTKSTDTPTRSASQCPTPKFTILKRPSSNANKGVADEHLSELPLPPRTPPKAIPVKGNYRTRNSVDIRNRSTSNGTSSSESSAEVDSDGNPSVFDPPLSGKRGVVQVGTSASKSEHCYTPPSSCSEGEELPTPAKIKGLANGGVIRVQPIAYKSASGRRAGLLNKLMKAFPDYAETVSQIGQSTSTSMGSGSGRPIHVFVDVSNIMVGFHDSVKISRDIPVKTRIRRLPLSFRNFSLILERGRPTAKRVLVGSDRFAAIDEAENIGYEANILDRVHKVKHMTPRQLKKYPKPNNGYGSADAPGGSETNGTPGERWVEQGVDEILHLKILESLVDTEEPATIVLATGDAAEAEYSGGFMKMVERALQRGWTVELVSFWQVTSYAYRKKEFRTKWGSRFRMIKLDDYIEELLDM